MLHLRVVYESPSLVSCGLDLSERVNLPQVSRIFDDDAADQQEWREPRDKCNALYHLARAQTAFKVNRFSCWIV